MSNITTEETSFNDELQMKMKAADTIVKEYIDALQKENARIQKLRAKEEVKNKSEQNYLREQIENLESELKSRPTVTVVIDRTEGINDK